MSSHYFVREGQEPALFILEPLAYSLVKPFLEWAPYVLVADVALDQALSWGIRIDAVLTYDENNPAINGVRENQVVEVLRVSNPTDAISSAVKMLREKGQTAVTITIPPDKHIFEGAAALHKEIELVLVDATHRWLPVSGAFRKWLPHGTRYKVRKSAEDQRVSFEGLQLENGTLISERDGIVQVSSDQVVWLGELLEN